MAGRKRKAGMPRKANGKIDTAIYQKTADAGAVVREQRRRHFGAVEATDNRNGKGRSHANDRRYGYALGRLLISGIITQKQHDMGLDFAELFADFRRVSDMPPPVCKAIDHLNATKPRPRELEPDEARAITRRYVKVCKKLDQAGVGLHAAVYGVVICDNDIDYSSGRARKEIATGLEAIVKHFSPRIRRVPQNSAGMTNKLVI